MSYKRVCILSIEEGEVLRTKGPSALDCARNHHHCSPDEADVLLTDSESRPWLNDFCSKPMAIHGELPDGEISRRHIIQIMEFKWVVRGRPVSGWQLIPSKGFA